MATKLRFPKAANRSFQLTFLRPDGDPEDLTGATFAAFYKRSVFDANEDALADLSARVAALDAEAGTAVFAPDPDDATDLDSFEPKEWEVRATLSDGRVVSLDQHMGPLVFAPLEGSADIAEPPNDYVEAYSAGLSGDGSAFASITGLTGGTAADLDGLSAARLAGLPNGSFLPLFFSGSIAATYRIRARSPGNEAEVSPASGGFKIVCDNDTTRIWELVSVWKEGVPCVWNSDTTKWHQTVGSGSGSGVSVTPAQESDAFSLPA